MIRGRAIGTIFLAVLFLVLLGGTTHAFADSGWSLSYYDDDDDDDVLSVLESDHAPVLAVPSITAGPMLQALLKVVRFSTSALGLVALASVRLRAPPTV